MVSASGIGQITFHQGQERTHTLGFGPGVNLHCHGHVFDGQTVIEIDDTFLFVSTSLLFPRDDLPQLKMPVWTSFRIKRPITGGRARVVLVEKLLTHLSPAAFFRGRYPGMA